MNKSEKRKKRKVLDWQSREREGRKGQESLKEKLRERGRLLGKKENYQKTN